MEDENDKKEITRLEAFQRELRSKRKKKAIKKRKRQTGVDKVESKPIQAEVQPIPLPPLTTIPSWREKDIAFHSRPLLQKIKLSIVTLKEWDPIGLGIIFSPCLMILLFALAVKLEKIWEYASLVGIVFLGCFTFAIIINYEDSDPCKLGDFA